MRRGKWAFALLFGLLLAAPAWAQRAVTFGGVNPLAIVNQPIDTNNSAVPIARPQQLENTRFSLKNILPRPGLPGAKTTIGSSQFPSQGGMPGANYLKAFHFQRPQPVQP
jgi:hypothetical protein